MKAKRKKAPKRHGVRRENQDVHTFTINLRLTDVKRLRCLLEWLLMFPNGNVGKLAAELLQALKKTAGKFGVSWKY